MANQQEPNWELFAELIVGNFLRTINSVMEDGTPYGYCYQVLRGDELQTKDVIMARLRVMGFEPTIQLSDGIAKIAITRQPNQLQ